MANQKFRSMVHELAEKEDDPGFIKYYLDINHGYSPEETDEELARLKKHYNIGPGASGVASTQGSQAGGYEEWLAQKMGRSTGGSTIGSQDFDFTSAEPEVAILMRNPEKYDELSYKEQVAIESKLQSAGFFEQRAKKSELAGETGDKEYYGAFPIYKDIELDAKTGDLLASGDDTIRQAYQLINKLKSGDVKTGPVSTRIRQGLQKLPGGGSEDFNTYQADVEMLRAVYRKFLTGTAANATEMQEQLKFLPSVGLQEDVAINFLETMIANTKGKRDALLMTSGVNPGEWQIKEDELKSEKEPGFFGKMFGAEDAQAMSKSQQKLSDDYVEGQELPEQRDAQLDLIYEIAMENPEQPDNKQALENLKRQGYVPKDGADFGIGGEGEYMMSSASGTKGTGIKMSSAPKQEAISKMPTATSPELQSVQQKIVENIPDEELEEAKEPGVLESLFGAIPITRVGVTLQDAPSDIKEGYENITKRADERADNVGNIQGMDAGKLRKAWWTFGQGAGMGADIVGTGMITALKALTTPEEEAKIKEVFTQVAGDAMNAANEWEWVENLKKKAEDNPEIAQDVYAALNILDLATSFTVASYGAKGTGKLVSKADDLAKMAQKGGKSLIDDAGKATKKAVKGTVDDVVDPIAKQGARVLDQTADLRKTGAEALDRTMENVPKHVLAKYSGFEPETVDYILKNPAFKMKDYDDLSRQSVFTQLREGVESRKRFISDVGDAYKPIRESDNFIHVDEGFLDDILVKKLGYKIKNGKIMKTRSSKFRANKSDLNKIQQFYDDWASGGDMMNGEYLNMREELSNLANYNRLASTQSKASEDIANVIRKAYNKTYRQDIPGLEDLDNIYRAEKKNLKDVMSTVFNKQGEVKDGAISTIRGYMKGSKNLNVKGAAKNKLELLETIYPDIQGQMNILEVVEDVRRTAANKVGAYPSAALSVGGGAGAGAMIGGAPGALIGGVLGLASTSPDIAVSMIKAYGKVRGMADDAVDGIIQSIKAGKASKKEKGFVRSAMAHAGQKLDDAGKKLPRVGMSTIGTDSVEGLEEAIKQTQKNLDKAIKTGNKASQKTLRGQLDDLMKQASSGRNTAKGFSEAGSAIVPKEVTQIIDESLDNALPKGVKLPKGDLPESLVKGRIDDIAMKLERAGLDGTEFRTAMEGKTYKSFDDFSKAAKANLGGGVDDLVTQAKQFKSADDFVKGQTTVYHGSRTPLNKFDNKQGGVYFTDDYFDATGFGGSPDNVYEGYLDFKNPLVVDAKGAKWDELDHALGSSTQSIIANAEGKYDGVVFNNIVDNIGDTADFGGKTNIFYAYKPEDAFVNENQLKDIWKLAKKSKK